MPQNTGLGIVIWHGAGAPACSSKRFRLLHPSGRAANCDGRPSTPDRRFPHVPLGSWFLREITPAGPNARTKVRRRPPKTETRIMTPHSVAYPDHGTRRTGSEDWIGR